MRRRHPLLGLIMIGIFIALFARAGEPATVARAGEPATPDDAKALPEKAPGHMRDVAPE